MYSVLEIEIKTARESPGFICMYGKNRLILKILSMKCSQAKTGVLILDKGVKISWTGLCV